MESRIAQPSTAPAKAGGNPRTPHATAARTAAGTGQPSMVGVGHPRCRARSLTAGLAAVLAALVLAPPAHADSPPPNWVNHRVLTCAGVLVDTYLTPAGFGTPFHVTGSPDVIIPKHVEVIFPGQTEPVTTLDVPGFDPDRRDAVQCTYTDPAGLFVAFSGVRI